MMRAISARRLMRWVRPPKNAGAVGCVLHRVGEREQLAFVLVDVG